MAQSLTRHEEWQRDAVGVRWPGGESPKCPRYRKRPQPPVLPATLVVNDLLTLPLEERLESFLADGDPGLDADVPSDLAQEQRCDMAPFVDGDRRAAALGITELLVGAALATT